MKNAIVSLAGCIVILAHTIAYAQDTGSTSSTNTSSSERHWNENLKEGWYTQLTGSATFFNDKRFPLFTGDGREKGNIDYDTGWGSGLGFGYRFTSGFRFQMEATYGRSSINEFEKSGNDIDLRKGDLETANALFGLYYDFNTNARWTPYIGLGGGAAWTDINDVAGRTSNQQDGEIDGTAYAEAGLEFMLGENTSLVPAYRFQWINNSEHGSEDDEAHIIMVGLRYYFE